MRPALPWLIATLPLVLAGAPPVLTSVSPMGGQRGSTLAVELRGDLLANVRQVEFDTTEIVWRETAHQSRGRLRGEVRIAPTAALGPHWLRVHTADGVTTAALFNVGQFTAVAEEEPNEHLSGAQPIPALPAEIYGEMDTREDTDVFRFSVRAGQRLLFDLISTDYGSALECKMSLWDGRGNRLAFNDDRDDFDDRPLIEHTFEAAGDYYVMVDQYRGPRAADPKNNPYILRISELPRVRSVSRLGARTGGTARVTISGSGLQETARVALRQVRLAEYYRMSYPYTMPVRVAPDPPAADATPQIAGAILSRSPDAVEAEFRIPPEAQTGLWRLWVETPHGNTDGFSLEVSEGTEVAESEAANLDWDAPDIAVNAILRRPGEKDRYTIQARAGRPIHIWTLAAQLGVPNIDTVLELRDAAGKRVASNDDLVNGVATLGNPDSSLFYTPESDDELTLAVYDRLQRGSSGHAYRLRIRQERPSFHLFTATETLPLTSGGKAELLVQMAREEGFEGEVEVWMEGLPEGATATRATFRADQRWEPGGDNLQMIVPEVTLRVEASGTLAAGVYPVRVFGAAKAESGRPDARVVSAHASLMIGPLTNLFNFTRRPLPALTLVAFEPPQGRITPRNAALTLTTREPRAELTVETADLPETAEYVVKDLPAGVACVLAKRDGHLLTWNLEAGPELPEGTYPVSVEAKVGDRWVMSEVIRISIRRSAFRGMLAN